MGKILSASEIHKQYNEMAIGFRRFIPDPKIRMEVSKTFDSYLRTCAFGVWQADNISSITPHHVEAYNAIYCDGTPSPCALYWEVATGVANFDLFSAPSFFGSLCNYDRLKGTSITRRFIDQLTLLMLLFAAADGTVSESEAGFINACSDSLFQLCDKNNLSSDRPPVNPADFISKKPTSASGSMPAAKQETKQAADTAPQPAPDLDEVLAELDSLCGLDQVKKDVKSLINLVKVRNMRKEADLPVAPLSLHLVFMGNPGTGKTTVARLLAKIYHAIGVLSKGQLIEVDRSGLVAGFVGQTALKTNEVIQSALGGVLFIDEAYSLTNQESANDFGKEAIEILLKGMEDHRKDLIVIVAGYTELMGNFISSNPGLASRFNKYFYFEDYNGQQLMEIFQSICKKNGYTLAPDAEKWAKDDFDELYETRDENFGNARDVRNLFEKAISRQSNRIAKLDSATKEQLMELTLADLQETDDNDQDSPQEDSHVSVQDALEPSPFNTTEEETEKLHETLADDQQNESEETTEKSSDTTDSSATN